MKKPKSASAERFIAENQRVIDEGRARSFSQIAKKSGYISQDFTDIKSGKKDLQRDFLDAVEKVYPIDKTYILTGEIKSHENITYKENVNLNANKGLQLSDNERPDFYHALPLKGEKEPIDQVFDISKWVDPNHVPIPVFDNTYGAETISELLNNESYKPTVILLKGHLGCHAVVRHIDSAMNKHFPARCQLGIERLRTFKKRIEPGKPYLVVLEELTVTRYVFETDKQFILRSSDIELYPDMHVDKEEIIEMWRIRSLTPIPDQQLF